MDNIVGNKVRPSLADFSISMKRRWLDELAMLLVQGDKDKVKVSSAHFAYIHHWVINHFDDDGYQLTHFTIKQLAYSLGSSERTAQSIFSSLKNMMMLVQIHNSGVVFGYMNDGTPGKATYLHRLVFADISGRPLGDRVNELEITTGKDTDVTTGQKP